MPYPTNQSQVDTFCEMYKMIQLQQIDVNYLDY